MTRNRDIERVLDEFYAEGPSAMPDRLFLGVIDRIERVPQRRLALLTRFATMNRNVRLALAAAIVVAIAGVGAFALSQRLGPGTQSTPSPTAGANPSATTFEQASVPAALQSRWVGPSRVVPQAPEPPYRNALELDGGGLHFLLADAGAQTQFASTAALVGPDEIRLRMASTDGGCQPGDEGTYAFSLSAEGGTLTLTSIAEACQPRSAALVGEWVRVGCSDPNGWCLGDLAPGAHVSTIFTPFVPAASWEYAYGKLAYSVPAGWANVEDYPVIFRLAKQGAPENTAIDVWTDVAPHGQADQCSPVPEPGVGSSADAIATWLTTLPGLVTTVPEPISIGGLGGKMVDLSVAPTWTASCPYAYSANLPLVSTFTGSTAGEGIDWNIQGEGRTRIVALDLGDGRALVINIEAQNTADFDALLPEAMQVVNSFVLNR